MRPYAGKGLHPVKFLHDNARFRVAKLVKKTLLTLDWDVLPAYSPDIAPSDYLFHSMENALSVCFRKIEETRKWVNECINQKTKLSSLSSFAVRKMA